MLDCTNQEELQLVFPRASYQLTVETSDGVLDFIIDRLILSRCLRLINLDHLTLRDIVSSHCVVDVCVLLLRIHSTADWDLMVLDTHPIKLANRLVKHLPIAVDRKLVCLADFVDLVLFYRQGSN